MVDGVDDLLIPRNGPHYWSPELRYHRPGNDIKITELAIVDDPATLGLGDPLELIPGDARAAADWMRCRHRPALAALLTRAHEADRRRRLGAPITILDRVALQVERLPNGAWIDGRGRHIDVTDGRGSHGTTAPSIPRSNSGHYKMVEGRMVEIFHSAPDFGPSAAH